MHLLDSNICIYILKNKFLQIQSHIEAVGIENVSVSSITVAELEYGAAKSNNPDQARSRLYEFLVPFEILDFDTKAAECYGRIRADLERKGTLIGPLDFMIAAIALAHNATVATNNENEFIRINDLHVENWTRD
jgi:tRNA(fMet)-specific endonuclease VapC